MIGVISKSAEIPAVEEFFQLFKTPWEFYQPGQSYDVVIATTEALLEVDTKLLLIYGSETRQSDRQAGIIARSSLQGVTLEYVDIQLPIYSSVLTFWELSASVLRVSTSLETVGLKLDGSSRTVMRVGYDLFQEVARLLTLGQSVEQAAVPTLDIHIRILRDCILNAGIPVLEIPPVPAEHSFCVCLTHDIDFAGIRNHKFDHTMWGFLYRTTVGAAHNFCRGRISAGRLLRSWQAAVLLPFVHLGLAKDFWQLFAWYLRVENHIPSTYFFIPFARRVGEKVTAKHPERRAASYDIAVLGGWISQLMKAGCEVGVHGIDAWHSVDKAREELERLVALTRKREPGIRMHWLLHDVNTVQVLEQAGYAYDSTAGYNETIGYLCGTTQPFRPLGARTLLELPLHIQDGALFYSGRLGLSEDEAWKRCAAIIQNARQFGGVLTINWHDRSPGPERFWGDFYVRLVQELRAQDVWFGTAGQVLTWFRRRREVSFQRDQKPGGTVRVKPCAGGRPVQPPFTLRVHRPLGAGKPPPQWLGQTGQTVDHSWTGKTEVDVRDLLRMALAAPSEAAAPVQEQAASF